MNEFPPGRAALLAKAARLAESGGLTVLSRECEAGGHRVDLVAATSTGTLIAIEVRAGDPDAVRANAADVTGERMLELLHAGAALLQAHDGQYDDFRVAVVMIPVDGSGETPGGQAGENTGAGL